MQSNHDFTLLCKTQPFPLDQWLKRASNVSVFFLFIFLGGTVGKPKVIFSRARFDWDSIMGNKKGILVLRGKFKNLGDTTKDTQAFGIMCRSGLRHVRSVKTAPENTQKRLQQ